MGFDITEEPWFANERNGSLDEETFETIQKQLLSRETMYETVMGHFFKEILPLLYDHMVRHIHIKTSIASIAMCSRERRLDLAAQVMHTYIHT